MHVDLEKEVAAIFKNVFGGETCYLVIFHHSNTFVLFWQATTYSPNCFNNFTELYSSISTDFNCLVITADFNFLTDDLNVQKKRFTILDTFELSQHVIEATHCKGHTLTLVITKGLNVSDLSVTDPSLSDQFVFSLIYILFPTYRQNQVLSKNGISMNIRMYFLKRPSPCNHLSTHVLLMEFNLKVWNS